MSNTNNIEKLNKLRSLPRGSNIDSRIAAIKDLLGEAEVFKTIQNLRWPEGIICPRCRSTNVVRREPPKGSKDKRAHYECLNCESSGDLSEFDDLTGLPVETTLSEILGDVQTWILCWYLIGFCSLGQVAKILGLSLSKIRQMAELGTHVTELSKEAKEKLEKGFFVRTPTERARLEAEQKKAETLEAELHTRSESKSPFKPGPKSQK